MAETKKLTVGIVGLGLIGGSLAKAAREGTPHTVLGMDTNPSVVLKARLLDAIDDELTVAKLKTCDILLVAIHPEATLDFLRDHAAKFNSKGMVIDCCGIKRGVCKLGFELAKKYGFTFIGGHPMAGKERSGFEHSARTLFSRASMILVPPHGIELEKIGRAKEFFLSLGFGSVKLTTPEEHDRMIAYTSHLAHVLSSSFVKSEAAKNHRGFSAGSFRDMTRVATLHAGMWTELFMANRDNLAGEVDNLITHLAEYRDTLKAGDRDKLYELLDAGAKLKAEIDKQ
jgi:prephenate dehydrogenase